MVTPPAGDNLPEYIRLPKPGTKCALTGLSRTSLVQVIDERDPRSGEFLVLQYTKRRHGQQRGIRMINRASLLAHLERRAKAQCGRHFAEGANNPEGHSVEEVISDYELWSLFVDPEGESNEKAFKKLSREKRIEVLDDLGWLAPMGS